MSEELKRFIAKYTGVLNVGDTEGNKGECVGLIQEWLNVFGFPQIWGNAIDLLKNADRNFYLVISNSPTNAPQPGDIIVFNYKPFGHTGVVVTADIMSVTVFESNNPVGSTPRIVKHTYKDVVGWIRMKESKPKLIATIDTMTSTIKEYFRSVKTHGLDPSDLESAQAVYDTWADVALNNKYHKNGECEKSAKYTVTPGIMTYPSDYEENKAKLEAFAQLGYNTPEDITKAIQKEREKFINLSHDQIEVEKKNEALALTLAEDSRNNYTAMEEGLRVIDEKKQLEEEKIEIAKALGVTKPSTPNMVSKIYFIQNLAEKWRGKLEDDAKKREEEAKAKGKPRPQRSPTTTAFLSLLKLIPNTQKGGVK